MSYNSAGVLTLALAAVNAKVNGGEGDNLKYNLNNQNGGVEDCFNAAALIVLRHAERVCAL